MDNYAIDTAARFGEIPFVEFTEELVTGTFECLLEAHIKQMEAYATFLNSLTQDLSTYINNTVDNVSFSEITDFLINYQLPTVTDSEFQAAITALQSPTTSHPDIPTGTSATPAGNWWQGLINSIGPTVTGLLNKNKDDKLLDTTLASNLQAIDNYNSTVSASIPSYQNIQQSIAALIASNKYGLLQNMSKQGMLRLVVTEGEIETRITFSTWVTSSSGSETDDKNKALVKSKATKSGGILGILKKRSKDKNRTLTVNTAKSYQRDSSGSRVDIFGRVLIRFKTDYAPLNA